MVDKNWIAQNEVWIKAQESTVEQFKNNIEYDKTEIKFHELNIEHTNQLIFHYQAGIAEAKDNLEKHISENKG